MTDEVALAAMKGRAFLFGLEHSDWDDGQLPQSAEFANVVCPTMRDETRALALDWDEVEWLEDDWWDAFWEGYWSGRPESGGCE